MTIPSAAKPTPIEAPNANESAVDPRTGRYSMQELQRQNKQRNYIVGMGRIIPCSASGTNHITLKPNGTGGEDGESPLLDRYTFGDVFLFVTPNTTTGPVTAAVTLKTGTLGTIKVYKDNGAIQANSGDLTQNYLYSAYYVPQLDSGNGGLVRTL